jgi:hypothetical protein
LNEQLKFDRKWGQSYEFPNTVGADPNRLTPNVKLKLSLKETKLLKQLSLKNAHVLGSRSYESPPPEDFHYCSPLDIKILKYLFGKFVPPIGEKPYSDAVVTQGDISMLSHFGVSLSPMAMVLKFKFFFNFEPTG